MDVGSPYQRWLRITGFITTTLVWTALYMELVAPLKECPFQYLRLWIPAFLLSSLGLWGLSEPRALNWSMYRWLPLLVLTTLPIFVMAYFWPSTLTGLLLVFPASLVGQRFTMRQAALWVVIHAAFVGYIMKCVLTIPKMTLLMLIYGTLQAFAVLIARMARSESASKQELTRTLGELRATQELVAAGSRLAERMQIARELHDVMGHRLSAASLSLEAASRQVSGGAQENVATAHQLVRGLLRELRDLVSTMRSGEPLDLGAALMALTEGIQSPCIHLSIRNEVELDDPLKAQTVVRCAQEFITNAMKHAQAHNLWITVESHSEGLMLRAEDDGVGAPKLQEGNGLKGMRERLSSVGGYMELAKGVRGFRASVWIPQTL